MRRFDSRTFTIMLVALLIGAGWATFNYLSAGGVRDDATLRPLIWAIFATPAALFGGWLIARRAELALAAFCCFCLYFLVPFVAARLESLVAPAESTKPGGVHEVYFISVIALHLAVGLGLVCWRALQPRYIGAEELV